MELVQNLFLLKNMYEKTKLSVCLPRGITVFSSNVQLKHGCNAT